MRRNKIRVYLHFIWATWDRQPLVTEEMERDLYRYIEQICRDNRCEVLAIGGTLDHVHLFVTFPNSLTFADLMKNVKGGSAHFVSAELRPGEWFQWQGHYGVYSFSPRHKKYIIRYVEDQKQHHADGTLLPAIEEPYEEYDDLEAEEPAT
jgi:putative transposase